MMLDRHFFSNENNIKVNVLTKMYKLLQWELKELFVLMSKKG
ncbi:hypothetical protein BACSP_04443 [Bacillus sp. T2.9-1]|nr:hypothetical protein BACSP_04443 [Bacillus sp. T2.9-1]